MIRKPRVLFICGSINQTSQMHQIARELPEMETRFTPFYGDGAYEFFRRVNWVEFTILGNRLRRRCLDYLNGHDLPIDLHGQSGHYDLVLTCTDLIIPKNVVNSRLLLVQEGILDPANRWLSWIQRFPQLVPRWFSGTAATGLSRRFDMFCVASEGYRDHFAKLGVPHSRMTVTGIPNFDNCESYYQNDFPHRHYVLVCTSDARETFKRDDRKSVIRRAVEIAAGRPLIFKLHPNENAERATAEIHSIIPSALVFREGSAEHMVANCDVFIAQYSSTAFVAMALGKEVHSYFSLEELKRLLPVQNRCAATNIAQVCRDLIAKGQTHRAPAKFPFFARRRPRETLTAPYRLH